jgi:hypothetical protein
MEKRSRFLKRITILGVSLAFILWSSVYIYRSSFVAIDGNRYFTLADDAMISMRYAWNFSHGQGLVWNPGERIEGYSNLLMTLFMSFATWAFDKSNAALFIQISGVVFLLAIAYVSMRIADHISRDQFSKHPTLISILTFSGILTYYPLVSWSLSGMETGLLTLLLMLAILYAFYSTKSKNPMHLYTMAIFMGLAFLTRNDSIIFSMLIWAYIFWERYSVIKIPKKFWNIISSMGILLLFVIGQQVFRYLYYGEITPNTYTLKLTGMPFTERIINGFGFIKLFLVETSILLGFSTIDQLSNFRKRNILLISIVFSSIGYQVYIGGDPWNYWRIMSPTIPLLIILFIFTIHAIIVVISNTQVFRDYFFRKPIIPRKYVAQVMIVIVVFSGLIFTNRRFMPEILLNDYAYQTSGKHKNFVNIAVALNHLTKSDATIGVFTAGNLAYYAERKAIDFLGKSDRTIAELPPDVSGKISWFGMRSVPGHNKYDLNYSIKKLKPTYVQRFKWGKQDLSEWSENTYILVEYDGVSLYLLKDSPDVHWDKVNLP